MSRRVPILIAAALIVSFAAPASAQVLTGQRERERVYYGDLDLYNVKDAEVMLDRVDGAAFRVCGGEDASTRREREHVSDCSDESTNRAVRQLDHPVVTALNEGVVPEVVIAEGDAAYPDYPVK